MAIIREVRAGIPDDSPAEVVIEADRARAIKRAIASAAAGDVILIAGKGHEDYQIVSDGMGGTVKRHLDDREQARLALAARGIEPLTAELAGSRPAGPGDADELDGAESELDEFDIDWMAGTNGAGTEQV